MGSVVVVGPVRGENLVGLAAEQQVELLLEDAVELFAERLIEIGHLPAAELEALGWILGRPAGSLHDAIHGNHGADDNLPHGSLSLFVSRQPPNAPGRLMQEPNLRRPIQPFPFVHGPAKYDADILKQAIDGRVGRDGAALRAPVGGPSGELRGPCIGASTGAYR